MKTLIKYVFIVVVSFSFTGCMSLKFPIINNTSYINNNVDKRYSKINDSIIIIKKESGVITQEKELRGGMVNQIVNIDTSIAGSASKGFMEQYFSSVKYGTESQEAFLHFSLEIIDFNFELNQGYTPSFDLKLNVMAKKNGKVILKKEYLESTETPTFLVQLKLYQMSHKDDQEKFVSESLHLGLLNFLETKVKPDLLKALKESI